MPIYVYELTVAVKVFAGVIFFGGYMKSRRKSALLIALGWLVGVFLPSPSPEISTYEPLMIGASASLTLAGILRLLEEETQRPSNTWHHISISILPLLYGGIEAIFGESPNGTYVVVGVLLTVAGLLSWGMLTPKYLKSGLLFGGVITASGALAGLKPIISSHFNISPKTNAEISLIIALLMAIAYYRIILNPKFLNHGRLIPEKTQTVEDNMKSLLSPEEFQRIAEELSGYPVLAFLRGEKPREGWVSYKLQTLGGERRINPRNLHHIVEIANRYLSEIGRDGRGVIILDSPEFLRIYNDFSSVAKMITRLQDLTKEHEGRLIVVSDPETWEEREWKILKRILA